MKILFILNEALYGSAPTAKGAQWIGWADKVLVF